MQLQAPLGIAKSRVAENPIFFSHPTDRSSGSKPVGETGVMPGSASLKKKVNPALARQPPSAPPAAATRRHGRRSALSPPPPTTTTHTPSAPPVSDVCWLVLMPDHSGNQRHVRWRKLKKPGLARFHGCCMARPTPRFVSCSIVTITLIAVRRLLARFINLNF